MLRVAEHFAATDVGRQRTGNEDAYFARPPLFVVADGMGGAQAGEVASQEAAAAFEPGLPDGDVARSLEQVIRDANRRIHDMSREDAQRAGMGTTLTAAYADTDRIVVAHVGDSRCYLWRGGELARLTDDHSLVEELVRRGKLTPEQAEQHPQRSVITRALGPEPDVQVDLEPFEARHGDVFLLCSDGLTSMISDATVKSVLEIDAPLAKIGKGLIDTANQAGGRDNITVILFRVEDVERTEDTADAEATRAGDSALSTEEVAAAVRAEEERDRTGAVAVADAPRRTAPLPASASGGSPPRSPTPPPARRRRRVPAFVIVTLVLAGLVLSGAWIASRAVYFLGTDPRDDRTVVLFRGLPYELPGGIELYERVSGSGLTLDTIPERRRELFTDHKLRSREDAEDLLAQAEEGRLVE